MFYPPFSVWPVALAATQPPTYRIAVAGTPYVNREETFPGMTIETGSDGVTTLQGSIPDQRALFAVLNRLRDLGLPLVSVARLDAGR